MLSTKIYWNPLVIVMIFTIFTIFITFKPAGASGGPCLGYHMRIADAEKGAYPFFTCGTSPPRG